MKLHFKNLLMILGTVLVSAGMTYGKEPSLLEAHLRGFQEVPVVSTVATGEFRGVIDATNSSILFDLSYTGIQGTVTQAHIHVGQRNVNGGIVIWFCQTATNPGPTGTPPCTDGSGHFTGAITSANVVATPPPPNGGQQIFAGDFDKVLEAIRAGKAYANVHSTLSPGGEIRGQIKVVTRHDEKGKDDQGRDDRH